VGGSGTCVGCEIEFENGENWEEGPSNMATHCCRGEGSQVPGPSDSPMLCVLQRNKGRGASVGVGRAQLWMH
jgi:hypothetical protein